MKKFKVTFNGQDHFTETEENITRAVCVDGVVTWGDDENMRDWCRTMYREGTRFQETRAVEVVRGVVGEKVTLCLYSDRHAYTVVKVSPSGKQLTARRVKAELLNGANSGEKDALTVEPGGFAGHTSGVQRYRYTEDPNGSEEKFTLRKNGRFMQVGSSTCGLIPGHCEYYDFNF